MPDRVESVDVLEVLAAMLPDSVEEEKAWPVAARAVTLDRVVAEMVGRRPRLRRQWMARFGWLAAGAAAAATLVLLLPGALELTRPGPGHSRTTPTSSYTGIPVICVPGPR